MSYANEQLFQLMESEIAALRSALKPSTKTKAAYIGEFSFPKTYTDEYGDEVTVNVSVPWTTIKEIMKAISAFAASPTQPERGQSNDA